MTATADPQPAPPLELRGIHAGYGKVPVLRDISVIVPCGSIVTLLGANGAGKTTMLRVLLGLVRPTSGQATIWAKPYRELGNQRRRAAVIYGHDVA